MRGFVKRLRASRGVGSRKLAWYVRHSNRLLRVWLVAMLMMFPVMGAHVLAKQDPAFLMDEVSFVQLPVDAQMTYRLIARGGAFRYAKDGSVFGNYERRLPLRNRGYYREYTVPTPGVSHRGARRIVCGGDQRMVNDCYYTENHYNSFKRIMK